MSYKIKKTDKFDVQFQQIVNRILMNLSNKVAMKFLDEVEVRVALLKRYPYSGTEPRYLILKRQGYMVLVVPQNLIFYKVFEETKEIILYAIVNQRQDYVKIINQIG